MQNNKDIDINVNKSRSKSRESYNEVVRGLSSMSNPINILPAHRTHNKNTSISMTSHNSYSSYLSSSSYQSISPSQVNELEDEYYNDPRWDDMFTFRDLKIPYRTSSSTTSFIDTTNSDENTSIFRPNSVSYQSANPTSKWNSFLFRCTNSMISRALLLVLFPVAIVSIWCSVPLQVVEVDPGDSDNPHDAYQMKFWFFLLFYYGFYNLTALLMVSQYFNLYSFHWWPKSIGGLWSTFFFWLFSMFLGSLIYYFNFFYKSVYTWVLLTFITLMLPLFSAFLIIRNEKRNVYRHSLTDAQKIFLLIQDNRIPYSYKRFLWFCFTLIINFSALILGETYALKFTSTEDKSWLDGIIYVYTWVVTVFILDFICDYIVETRIRSWALSHVYRLYFALIYFVFYRNLFIKLRSAEQFYTVQICSSLWVIFNYPLRMSKFVYNITKWFGSKRKYEDYCKNVGRSFFIRNLAENASMVGFLCWVNILHFGQNSRVYPHFGKFDPDITNPGNNNFYPLRITASLGVWVCELLSAFITRLIFKKVYDHSITREAVQDFYRYPEVIRAMILVTIHVLQDMLLALINLQTLT